MAFHTHGSASDSRARGAKFYTWSDRVVSFPFPLIQAGQLSDTGEIYWPEEFKPLLHFLIGFSRSQGPVFPDRRMADLLFPPALKPSCHKLHGNTGSYS